MTLARGDLVVASGAAVRLHGLVRLHVADLDRAVGIKSVRAHRLAAALIVPAPGPVLRSSEEAPEDERDHDDERGRDEEDVAAVLDLLPERVETHATTVAVPGSGAGTAEVGTAFVQMPRPTFTG